MSEISVLKSLSELIGRRKIYTDEKNIDETNIAKVLEEALIIHFQNSTDIDRLDKFEKGEQPLQRNKVIRPEIDVEVVDNIANEVTEFKLGYNWGTPFEYVQRGKEDFHQSDEETDDRAVSMLNEMFQESGMAAVNQEMARMLEICGLGYKMIEMKADYDPDVDTSVFNITSLDPRFAFVVYSNDAWRKPMMAVSYMVTDDGGEYYTCITKDYVYELKKPPINSKIKVVGEKQKIELVPNEHGLAYKNRYGMINIIEYNRSTDRMGCFERQIDEMNGLNIMISDFINNVSQQVQSLWHANDCDFPIDEETGEEQTPKTGDWIHTVTTGSGQKPFLTALSSEFSSDSTIVSINDTRERILQKCDVPSRGDNSGGSTGSAMSMTSGWNDAELSAGKEMIMIEKAERDLLRVALKIVHISSKLKQDSALLDLKVSDVKIKFPRNKSYDMATKSNTFATYISHGMHPRHALELVDIGGDIEQIYIDSKDMFDKYQENLFTSSNTTTDTEDKIQSDISDQYDQSPIAKI